MPTLLFVSQYSPDPKDVNYLSTASKTVSSGWRDFLFQCPVCEIVSEPNNDDPHGVDFKKRCSHHRFCTTCIDRFIREKGHKKCLACGAAIPIYMAIKKRVRCQENQVYPSEQRLAARNDTTQDEFGRKRFKLYHNEYEGARFYPGIQARMYKSTDQTYFIADNRNKQRRNYTARTNCGKVYRENNHTTILPNTPSYRPNLARTNEVVNYAHHSRGFSLKQLRNHNDICELYQARKYSTLNLRTNNTPDYCPARARNKRTIEYPHRSLEILHRQGWISSRDSGEVYKVRKGINVRTDTPAGYCQEQIESSKSREGIPVCTKTPSTPPRKRKASTFNERFEELVAFKAKHGHCNPPSTPTSEYASIGKWANHVRLSYRQLQNNTQPHIRLTEEHIKRLTNAGFVWNVRKKSFEVRFKDLTDFKNKYGHCDVPTSRSSEYFTLGEWCRRLKQSYARIQDNRKPLSSSIRLPKERIQNLTKLGFDLKRATK
jgi:hypothetical protein